MLRINVFNSSVYTSSLRLETCLLEISCSQSVLKCYRHSAIFPGECRGSPGPGKCFYITMVLLFVVLSCVDSHGGFIAAPVCWIRCRPPLSPLYRSLRLSRESSFVELHPRTVIFLHYSAASFGTVHVTTEFWREERPKKTFPVFLILSPTHKNTVLRSISLFE